MNLHRLARIMATLTVAALAATSGLVLFLPRPASATWSLVAVDPETGEVGVAMASCAAAGALGEPDEVLFPVVLVPGRGAGVAQGTLNVAAPDQMSELLKVDGPILTASDVVEGLQDSNFDERASLRQYAVATLPSTSGTGMTSDGFTGDDSEPAQIHLVGDGVASQGMRLVSESVATAALDEFEQARASGASLAEALIDGLNAGSFVGGDQGCGQQTALFAHLAIASIGDDPLRPSTVITVTVDEDDGQNPVPLLDAAFKAGDRGWVDAGQNKPATTSRSLVLAVAVAMGVAAALILRKGMRGA